MAFRPNEDPDAIFCHGLPGRPCNNSWIDSRTDEEQLRNILLAQQIHQENYERKIADMAYARAEARAEAQRQAQAQEQE